MSYGCEPFHRDAGRRERKTPNVAPTSAAVKDRARKSAAGRLNLQEVTENIHAMDFEALIAEAVAAGQYRRAVRLNFLKSLRLLTEKQHIHWKPEKTNRDYLEELTPSELRLPFQELATRYEYIWYGDFPVDASRYEDARLRFEQFHRQLRGQHDSR